MEPRGYRCFAPSLPAHDAVPDQPLMVARQGLRDYVDHLEREVNAQGFTQPPVLMGHSMGGLLAQQLALRIKPAAMVLLTPAPFSGVNGVRVSNLAVFAPWMFGGLFWRNPHKPSFERACISAFNGIPPDRHRRLYEGLVHESGRAAAEIALWWLDFSRAAAVDTAAIRCPVYIVSCGEDRLTPAAVVRKVSSAYPHAALRHYPRRGHWVVDDDETDEMIHGICGWLRPIERRAHGTS